MKVSYQTHIIKRKGRPKPQNILRKLDEAAPDMLRYTKRREERASAVATVPATVANVNPQMSPSLASDLNANVKLV